MKKFLATLLSVVTLLSSCTDDGFLEKAPSGINLNGKVHVSLVPFQSGDPTTRTTVSCGDSDEGLFGIGDWDPDFDMIGLANVTDDELDSDYQLYGCPVDWETEDDGVSFTFSNPDDEQMLDTKSLYRIIYPFNSENIYENERGVKNGMYFYFDGQKQMEDNSTEHLCDYVFYHSYRFHWREDKPVNVRLESECSILKMELTLPKGIYKSITIENVYGDLVFDKYIKYDLSSGMSVHSHNTANSYHLEFDPNNYASSSVSLELYDKSFNLKKETTCTFYLSVGASSTGFFRIKALTNKGKSYYTKILSPITLRFGKYYTIREKCVSDKGPDVNETGELNGHDWVDLGLPSHTKWATENVGIDALHAYGNYYAWGETTGHNDKMTGYDVTWTGTTNPNYKNVNAKNFFSWTYYKWCNGTDSTLTNVLDYDQLFDYDDVANVKWGNGWQMPSQADFFELWFNCPHVYVNDYNGSAGMFFYKKKRDVNGNPVNLSEYDPSEDLNIFLPAAGYYQNGSCEKGICAYWLSSISSNNSRAASFITNNAVLNGASSGVSYMNLCLGFNVRPVYKGV